MKILYVEDNVMNLRLVQRMLKQEHEVFGAATGKEGLQQIAAIRPDIILLDINLPDMNGFAVLEQVKSDSRFQNTPVIALTANAMYGDKDNILAAGFDMYLAKPVTSIELKNSISSCSRAMVNKDVTKETLD